MLSDSLVCIDHRIEHTFSNSVLISSRFMQKINSVPINSLRFDINGTCIK